MFKGIFQHDLFAVSGGMTASLENELYLETLDERPRENAFIEKCVSIIALLDELKKFTKIGYSGEQWKFSKSL